MISPEQTPTFSIGNGKVITIALPLSAGKWTISGNFHIHVQQRPRWLTRKLMWWLVEWGWEDA